MKAKSVKGKSPEEIKSELSISMADGFKPTLAFVFISIKQDINTICNLLDQQDIQIFGATSSGEFINGDISNGGIVVLLLDMNPSHFMILLEDYADNDPQAVTKAMAMKAKEQFTNPAFILSNSIKVTDAVELGEPVLRALESVTGPDTIIWGGRAGDDLLFGDTVVFSNKKLLKRGIILLVLDGDKIKVKGQAASGLKAVGTQKTITKAADNWIYEIDNQPASDMVLKYMGLNLFHEEAETFYPGNIVLSLVREKGEPVLRSSGIFNLKDKSIYIPGGIKEGDMIQLTLPPDFEIIEEVSRNAETMKQNELPDGEALLMFSCAGRLVHFGPMTGEEIDGIKNVFKVPMAGFFAYGEFGRTHSGNNEFHNNTCCWVALKEC